MGSDGLKRATEAAVLAANYVAARLDQHFPVLFKGAGGLVAHECILDLRPLTESTGVTAEDVAKRLIDFGFHAPTMSFPIPGTLMIEPTESESREELDRFIEAMTVIRAEIADIEEGRIAVEASPLRNAPHTASMVATDSWSQAYTRDRAAFPVASLRATKYWPPVRRIDNAKGDRHLETVLPVLEYVDTLDQGRPDRDAGAENAAASADPDREILADRAGE
jgi:glycine dehydrogenase